ncbi:MAG TPA: IS1595 family transposase, partial [Candidatus Paceibacterota bacterium]|nr:IS1595 family transposase [Candidatus Paceibacterota bacterium]
FIKTRRIWRCKECGKQFTVKIGTVMEDSPLGLDKWVVGMWLLVNAKNGISSYEIHRALGITQKSAWFLLHRLRLALKTRSFSKVSGTVEVDETYIGGLEENKHEHKKLHAGRGGVGKAIVMGIVERGGVDGSPSQVRAMVVGNTDAETLQGEVLKNVKHGSTVNTDSHASYKGLGQAYTHETINHAIEYVRGNVTTNRAENFFSCLKRTLKGTYISVDPMHLQAYVNEQCFRFNARIGTDRDRFLLAVKGMEGRRLTYKKLTRNGK